MEFRKTTRRHEQIWAIRPSFDRKQRRPLLGLLRQRAIANKGR